MRSPESTVASRPADLFAASDRAPAADAGVAVADNFEEAPQPASSTPDATSNVNDWRRSTLSSVVARRADGDGSTHGRKPVPHRISLVPISYQSEEIWRNLVDLISLYRGRWA